MQSSCLCAFNLPVPTISITFNRQFSNFLSLARCAVSMWTIHKDWLNANSLFKNNKKSAAANNWNEKRNININQRFPISMLAFSFIVFFIVRSTVLSFYSLLIESEWHKNNNNKNKNRNIDFELFGWLFVAEIIRSENNRCAKRAQQQRKKKLNWIEPEMVETDKKATRNNIDVIICVNKWKFVCFSLFSIHIIRLDAKIMSRKSGLFAF